MARKTNFKTASGKELYRVKRKVGNKLNANGEWVSNYMQFYGRTKREAEQKYQEYMLSIGNDSYSDKCLGKVIDEWIESVFINSNYATGTKHVYISSYKNHFKATPLCAKPISDITALELQTFFNNSNVCYTSKKQLLALLKHFYAYAEQVRLVPINITPMIEINRDTPTYLTKCKEIDIWEMDDVKKIIDLTQNTKLRFLVVMAINTGMRIGELLALDYNDIKDGVVRVNKQVQFIDNRFQVLNVKSASSVRNIPLSKYVLSELETHKLVHRAEMTKRGYITNHIFSNKSGGYLQRSTVTRALLKLYKANGLPQMNFHVYRHTFGTNLANAGYRLEEIAELMGHSSINVTTQYYINVSDARKSLAMESISALCL